MTGTATTRDSVAVHGKYTHHGRTPAAWAGSLIALVAFVVGCVGVVLINMPLIIGGVAGLALVVTQVMRMLGLGAD